MKQFLFFICTFACLHICIFTFAQQNKIDSLKTLLIVSKEDTAKVNILNSLSWEERNKNPEEAMAFAKESFLLSEKLNYTKGKAYSYSSKGVLYANQSNYDSALVNHFLSLKLKEEIKDVHGEGTSLVFIGAVYSDQGKYSSAIESYFKALAMFEMVDDKKGQANALNNIGNVNYLQNKYDDAVIYYMQALNLRESIQDKAGMAKSYNNIGLIYEQQKKYEDALKYYFKSIELKEELGEKRGLAYTSNNIGVIYEGMKIFDKAMKFYTKSLSLCKEIEDKFGMAVAYNNIGKIYLLKKEYPLAIEQLNSGLKLAQEIGTKEDIKSSFEGLTEAYSQLGNYERAYNYIKLFSQTKDSLLNEESSKQITEMQTKYETEKKEQKITLLNKDKELQDAQLNRQKIIIWSVAGGLVIVLSLSIFIFRERRKSEKLLLNILPAETAKELKAKGKATAKHYEQVTVMFTDFKGFTTIAEKLSAEELVSELDFLFKKFDEIISKYPIEKIKTIGDAYMCAGGLPTVNKTNAMDVVSAAIEIQNWMIAQNSKWDLRIGIHTGPVTAGVVGDKKFAYDIWGDAVNTASRMESSGEAGKINISGNTYELISLLLEERGWGVRHRGKIPAKNKGEIEMYFVEMNS